MNIRPITTDTACLYDQIDNRYIAQDIVNLHYGNAGFILSYTPLPAPIQRTYPPGSVFTAQEIIGRKDAECFFAFQGDQAVGQAVVTVHWNKLAFLWDLRVDASARRLGVGRALVDTCVNWAKAQGLKGLLVETQGQNPSACRFYQRYGFVLGGADRLLYAAIPNHPHPPDIALFFYLFFK